MARISHSGNNGIDRYIAFNALIKEAIMTTKKKGKAVLVTTSDRGVFFGYLSSIPKAKPASLKISNARNCIYWSAETKGFLGLAYTGPQEGSKVGPCVPGITLYGITSIAECSPEAVKKWEEGPWK